MHGYGGTTSVRRNVNFGKLQAGYLFPEIARRPNAFLESNPDADLISLGIGDTTEPIPDHILSGLMKSVNELGVKETYSGYGAEQGKGDLREKIAKRCTAALFHPPMYSYQMALSATSRASK